MRAHGMKGIVSSTEDFDVEELPNHKVLIIVISMCGLGEDPQNIKRIWMALQFLGLSMTCLSGFGFAVFDLGDSTYFQFCRAVAGYDARLGVLGGQLQRGVGDDRDED